MKCQKNVSGFIDSFISGEMTMKTSDREQNSQVPEKVHDNYQNKSFSSLIRCESTLDLRLPIRREISKFQQKDSGKSSLHIKHGLRSLGRLKTGWNGWMEMKG
jgi:hypothetical protein